MGPARRRPAAVVGPLPWLTRGSRRRSLRRTFARWWWSRWRPVTVARSSAVARRRPVTVARSSAVIRRRPMTVAWSTTVVRRRPMTVARSSTVVRRRSGLAIVGLVGGTSVMSRPLSAGAAGGPSWSHWVSLATANLSVLTPGEAGCGDGPQGTANNNVAKPNLNADI